MPRISAFYGIVITMYWRDHLPAHFHALYSGHECKVDIETLELIDGRLPPRAMRLINEWAGLHHDELRVNWALARARRPLNAIAPLP